VRGGRWDLLLMRLKSVVCGPWTVVFETTCGYGFLYDKLVSLGAKVVVAHPGRLRLIFRSKQKNDRVDARKLALLLLLDQVPAVWVPPLEGRKWRELIEARASLVHQRTNVKNALRALLRGCGISRDAGLGPAAPLAAGPRKGVKGRWTLQGLAALAVLELPTPTDALRRDLLMDQLRQVQQQSKRVEKTLNQIAAKHPGVALLRTIPGIGPRVAEAEVAYLGDPQRFTRHKQVGAYVGLVPSQDSSGGVNRLGHITKDGPATLRGLLTEGAWQAKRRSPKVRRFYERVQQGLQERNNIALVATAQDLVNLNGADPENYMAHPRVGDAG
jgi:transposase